MVQLTEELIEAFNALRVVPLATADKNGVPNVAPMGAKAVADPETILIRTPMSLEHQGASGTPVVIGE